MRAYQPATVALDVPEVRKYLFLIMLCTIKYIFIACVSRFFFFFKSYIIFLYVILLKILIRLHVIQRKFYSHERSEF